MHPYIEVFKSYEKASFFGKPVGVNVGFYHPETEVPTEAGQKFIQFCELSKLNGHASLQNFYVRSGGLFEVSFKGLIKMMYNTNLFSSIHSDIVLTGDNFKSGMRNNVPFIEHERNGVSGGVTRVSKSGEEIVGFSVKDVCGSYAVAAFKGGDYLTAVVNNSELLASMPRAITPDSVWYKFPGEMGKKVALKRLAKLALLAANQDDMVMAVDIDNQNA